HAFLDPLLQFGLGLSQNTQVVAHRHHVVEHRRHGFVIGEIEYFAVIAGIQALQGAARGFRTVGGWRRIRFYVVPEGAFQFDQAFDQLVIAMDAMHTNLLATDQHADIGCRLAGDSELVLDLALHILGYAIAPEPRTKFPGGLALQYLHVTTTDDGV